MNNKKIARYASLDSAKSLHIYLAKRYARGSYQRKQCVVAALMYRRKMREMKPCK